MLLIQILSVWMDHTNPSNQGNTAVIPFFLYSWEYSSPCEREVPLRSLLSKVLQFCSAPENLVRNLTNGKRLMRDTSVQVFLSSLLMATWNQASDVDFEKLMAGQ